MKRVGERVGGYLLESVLGQGSSGEVYRASKAGRRCAVKLFRGQVNTPERTLSFRREAAALAQIQHPGVVGLVELSQHGQEVLLAMELVEGETLARRIHRGPLGEDEALSVLRQLAEALAAVHGHGLVHRDLTPSNILLGREGRVVLIDFGLVGEQHQGRRVGTLAYASPEQLGLVERSVGPAADLYSLGATLFHAVSGTPPFVGADSARLLHSVATEPAPELRDLGVSLQPALEGVLRDLMRKNPDERYQSARGLCLDLERLNAPLPWVGHAKLRTSRVAESFQGRSAEKARIQGFLSQKEGGVLGVVAEAGFGKTRLVEEVVEAGDGPFLRSKCLQGDARPLSAVREALSDGLRRPTTRAALTQILRGLGPDEVRVLWVACPELEGLGELASVAPESQAMAGERGRGLRADAVVADVVLALSRHLGGLTWHLDDVQWLGERDLSVLLLTLEAPGAFRVVATSRALDVPLLAQVDGAQSIALPPLELSEVDALVAASLGAGRLSAEALGVVARSSGGNPFAVLEYTRAIRESGHLSFVDGVWHVSLEALAGLDLPQDLVALVLRRLDSLDAEARQVLEAVEVLAQLAVLPVLGALVPLTETQLRDRVGRGVELGLLEEGTEALRFQHDRIREAVGAAMPAARRRALHLAAARAVQAQGAALRGAAQATARFLEAASHAGAQVAPEELAQVNQRAGLAALEAQSFAEAYTYLGRACGHFARLEGGLEALPEPERLALWAAMARACAMTGHLLEARAVLERALPLARGRGEAFELGYLLTLTLASEGQNDAALDALYQSFEDLGRPYPRSRVLQALSLLWVGFWGLVWVALGALGLGRRLQVSGEAAEQRAVLSRLNYAGTMLAMFDGDTFLMVQFIVRDFLNVQRLGPCSEKAVAITVYGAVMGTFQLRRKMDFHCERGVRMAEQLRDPAAHAVCRSYQACGTKWAGDVDLGTQLQLQALPLLARHVPGSWYLAMMICEQAYSYHHQGRSQAAHQHVQRWLPELRRTNNRMFVYNTLAVDYAARRVLGDSAGAAQLWSALEQDYPALSGTGYAQLARVQASFEDFVDRRDTTPQVQQMLEDFADTLGEDYYSLYARSLYGYAHLDLAQSETPARAAQGLSRLKALRWATRARALAPVHAVHPVIWAAAIDRLEGRLGGADRKLKRAGRLVQGIHSPWASFRLALERARLSAALKEAPSQVQAHAERARVVAQEQGWRQKAQWVASEFALSASGEAGSSERTPSTPGTPQRSAQALLRVSLASSSSLDPELQAGQILEAVVEVFAAERALFYLLEGEPLEGQGLVLMASAGAGAQRASQTVVQRVLETGQPIVLAGDERGGELDSVSIEAQGLRSIMAAPLRWQEKTIGVLYLDNRLVKGIFSEGDLELLLALGSHIAIAIQTRRAALVKAQQQALSRDLDLVAAVQSLLLPRQGAVSQGPVSVSSFYRPANQCGGDWWWVDRAASDYIEVWMGDVSGHGAAAAMVTSSVAGSFHSVRSIAPALPIPEILAHLHGRVQELGGGFHMTMGVLRLHVQSGVLELWSAGSPPVFLDGGQGAILQASGTPLGARSAHFEVGHARCTLEEGGRALWCTDGLLELEHRPGRSLGPVGVMALLQSAPADGLIADLGRRFGTLPSEDDLTVLLLKREAAG